MIMVCDTLCMQTEVIIMKCMQLKVYNVLWCSHTCMHKASDCALRKIVPALKKRIRNWNCTVQNAG